MANVPLEPGLKGIKERIEVLEPIARTASKVHAWEGTSETPITMLFLEQDQPIDVVSSVSQDTTGSVPVQEPILPDTLDDKHQ